MFPRDTVTVYELTVYAGANSLDGFRSFRFLTRAAAERFAMGKVGIGGASPRIIVSNVPRRLYARWRQEGQLG